MTSISISSARHQLMDLLQPWADRQAPELTTVERLERLRQLSQLLDSAWEIPGTSIRFGIDSLVGLIPGIGDIATAAIAAYIVREAAQMQVSRWLLFRMSLNVTVDVLVGLIPVLGDAADLAFKANDRNMRLLEKHLAKQERRSGGR